MEVGGGQYVFLDTGIHCRFSPSFLSENSTTIFPSKKERRFSKKERRRPVFLLKTKDDLERRKTNIFSSKNERTFSKKERRKGTFFPSKKE